MFRTLFRYLGLSEKRCTACHAPFLPEDHPRLCPICQKLLASYMGPRCQKCGLPWQSAKICPQCTKNPPPWADIACHGLYEGLLRDLILRLKFDADLSLAPLFADFLLEACQNLPKPDCIMAIPQFPARLRKRGFNQAHEVAKILGKLSGLPVTTTILTRIKAGPAQESLGAHERRENMRDAFAASAKVAGKTIWLLDDVLTTGSTCRFATEALLKAGANNVYLLVLARTTL